MKRVRRKTGAAVVVAAAVDSVAVAVAVADSVAAVAVAVAATVVVAAVVAVGNPAGSHSNPTKNQKGVGFGSRLLCFRDSPVFVVRSLYQVRPKTGNRRPSGTAS
jgi:hypothetical protein